MKTERAAAPDARLARRRRLLGLAHKGAALLGLDEDTRRAAQQAYTGHASCADMTDQQLVGWLWELKRRGAEIGIPAPPPRGGTGYGRPTDAQRARIEQLAAALELSEAALCGFVRRTCQVDDLRFVTKSQASAVISGLTRWATARSADTRSRTRAALEALLAEEDGR